MITEAKVGLSIIQAIAVNMVNELVPGGVQDEPVHKDSSLSAFHVTKSIGVICISIKSATPIIPTDAKPIFRVNDGEFALS